MGLVISKKNLKLLSRGSCIYCDNCQETQAFDVSEDTTSESSSEHGFNKNSMEGIDAAKSKSTSMAPPETSTPADNMCCRPSVVDSPEQNPCCRKTIGEVAGGGERFFATLNSVLSQDFDMDEPHSQSPPFLGSSYWISGGEIQPTKTPESENGSLMEGKKSITTSPHLHHSVLGKEHNASGNANRHKGLISPKPSPLETFIQGETDSGTRVVGPPDIKSRHIPMPFQLTHPHPVTPKRRRSPDGGTGMSCSTVQTATTASSNVSHDNSIGFDIGFNTVIVNNDDVTVTYTPRRLFTDDSVKSIVIPELEGSKPAIAGATISCGYGMAVSQVAQDAASTAAERIQYCTSSVAAAMGTATPRKENGDLIIRNGVLLRGTASPCRTPGLVSLPSLSGVDEGRTSISQKRYVNTLPSNQRGKPIRLRVTETYGEIKQWSLLDKCNASADEHDSCSAGGSESEDVYEPNQFSYDPYFSLGQYHITTSSGRPWGNGLSVKMGVQYMTLQDKDGHVLAVTRSRHTWVPSHVIYSPKPRFEGQIPSSHRPITDGVNPGSQQGIVDLYPWALVRKEGRTMEHDVTIHFTEEMGSNTALNMNKGVGSFSPNPTFRSRHGFEGVGFHSHTVVSRFVTSETNSGGRGLGEYSQNREIPCCIIIRDPIDRDVFNMTIAPGIDPLLLVCYLAVHAKMDVEPMMSGL